MARYTFHPDDDGEVTLFITDVTATPAFNVNVSNSPTLALALAKENTPTEDASFAISNLVTPITYRDQFDAVSYTNNNASAFAGPWTEINDGATGASTGKVSVVTSGVDQGARFHNSGGGAAPELRRNINLSGYDLSAQPVLSFNWKLVGSPSGSFRAEGRIVSVENPDPNWVEVHTFTTPLSPTFAIGATYPLTSMVPAPGFNLAVTNPELQLRFRILSGFTSSPSNLFVIDNVQVSTTTNDCDVGSGIDHYSISHSGQMVSCQLELVTVTPHSINEEIQSGFGTTLILQTTSGKGTFSAPLGGAGSFSATPGAGYATYAYGADEGQLTFPFNYTNVTGNSETFTITASTTPVGPISLENQSLTAAKAGLLFFNETTNNTNLPTLAAGIPSNTYPGQTLVVQGIQADNNNPAVCVNVFAAGDTVPVELAFEMIDRAVYAATGFVVVNGVNIAPEQEHTPDFWTAPSGWASVPLNFEVIDGDGRIGARLNLTYSDAGAMQIHGRYNIPLLEDEDNPALNTGDYMTGSGKPNTNNTKNYTFVVRPYGFQIDIPDSPGDHYGNAASGSSWAPDANGSLFLAAATPFNTTVRPVAWTVAAGAPGPGGAPASGADLSSVTNYPTTPNFGNEDNAVEDDVTVAHTLVLPAGGTTGVLTGGNLFANFANGAMSAQQLSYNEVGIINLSATVSTSGGYLGGGQAVIGDLLNVGRFIPADFALTPGVLPNPALTDRPLVNVGSANVSSPYDRFTYMDEQLTARFSLVARNAAGNPTTNYIGDFAKLTQRSQLSFRAVLDGGVASDTSYTSRLDPALFPTNFQASWSAGQIDLIGNLVFTRLPDEAPDGPFGPLKVAVRVTDTDNVGDVNRNVTEDVDACNPNCGTDPKAAASARLLDLLTFRYGRIRLENGYGTDVADTYNHDEGTDPDGTGTPDVPRGTDVMVRVVAEYWDGTDFIPNDDDIATPYDSAELSFLTNTFTEALGNNEAAITVGDGKVYRGETQATDMQDDIPLYLRAPLTPNNAGSVIIELDLDGLGLSFLKFDWRDGTGAGEDLEADVKADPNVFGTTDNPRAVIDFGRFRGNDRIINWQEIFE